MISLSPYAPVEVIPMKRPLFALALATLVGGIALAMPLCDYRSPRTDLADLGMSFSYQYYNNEYGKTDRDISAGELKVDYTRLFDSPDFGFDTLVNSDITISLPDGFTHETDAAGSFKLYVAPDSLFFGFAGAEGKTSSSYEQVGLTARVGMGYGRFADVTPLAKAMKIDAVLVERGSLSAPSHPKDVEAMAYEIDSVASYTSLADLLDVLAEILDAAGQTKPGGLDALDLYEMGKIVEDAAYTRYCGGEGRLGLAYELLDPMVGPNDLLASVELNYGLTTTPRAQLLVQGKLSTAYDIRRTFLLGANVTYDYLVTDILVFHSSYAFFREVYTRLDAPPGQEGEPTDTHRLGLTFTFTPVDSARLSLEASLERRLPDYSEWKAEVTLQIGVDLL